MTLKVIWKNVSWKQLIQIYNGRKAEPSFYASTSSSVSCLIDAIVAAESERSAWSETVKVVSGYTAITF